MGMSMSGNCTDPKDGVTTTIQEPNSGTTTIQERNLSAAELVNNQDDGGLDCQRYSCDYGGNEENAGIALGFTHVHVQSAVDCVGDDEKNKPGKVDDTVKLASKHHEATCTSRTQETPERREKNQQDLSLQMKYDKLWEKYQQSEERNKKLSKQLFELKPTGLDGKIINGAFEQVRKDCEASLEVLLGSCTATSIMDHFKEHLKQPYNERDTKELMETIFEKSYWFWKEAITRESDIFDSLFKVCEHGRKPRNKMAAVCSHYQIVLDDMNVDKVAEEVTKKVFEEVKVHWDKENLEWLSIKDKNVDAHDEKYGSTDTENTSSKHLASNKKNISTLGEFVQTSVELAWKMVSLVPPMVIDRPNHLNAKELQQIPGKKCPVDDNFEDILTKCSGPESDVGSQREVHVIHYLWNKDLSPAEYELVYLRPVLYYDYSGRNMLNAVVANKPL